MKGQRIVSIPEHTIANLDLYFEADIEKFKWYGGEVDGIDMEHIKIDALECMTDYQQAIAKEYLNKNYRTISRELMQAISAEHYAWLDEVAAEMMIP